MLLTDYHIHSSCSSDGHNTMLEMAQASWTAGVSRLCFTDHCDMDSHTTGIPDHNPHTNRQQVLDMYRETLEKAPKGMKICLGIELGEMTHNREGSAAITNLPEFDFVLGSLHNLRNTQDFYELHYTDKSAVDAIMLRYADELLELSTLTTFDTVAHIGYPIRYMRRDGIDCKFDLQLHYETVEQMLKNLIANDRGIEINCSGFRNKLINESIPALDVLTLYRQLGGEIITVGSDAHTTAQCGVGLREGFDILRNLGYKYVTVFEKRKPEFIKI